MKNPFVTGVVTLALGFALGWTLKPTPPGSSPPALAEPAEKFSAPAASPASQEAAPLISGEKSERSGSVPDKTAQATREQARKMQSEMSRQMVGRLRARYEAQITKLAENLNLTPEQKTALSAWLAEKMAALEELDFTDPKSAQNFGELAKGLTSQAMEEQLAPTLTDDQKAALGVFKEKEHRTKVDTMALKSLSKIQGVIEFGEGQRDKVYEVLARSAEENLSAEDENTDLTRLMTEGMGIDADPYDLGLQKVITDSMGDPSAFPKGASDQKAIAGQLREAFDKRIESKVESLRPVLDDRQLELYRAELKSKGLGIYGTMLMGLESQ